MVFGRLNLPGVAHEDVALMSILLQTAAKLQACRPNRVICILIQIKLCTRTPENGHM